jgi:hypothetical protein
VSVSSLTRASVRPSLLDAGWILAILLALFAIAPLTYPGFFQVHSGFLPPFNVAHLSDAPNWGRLADLVRGEGKLPYLLAWPFLQASGSSVAAIKWGYGLAFVLGALGAYVWTRPWLGVQGSVLAAVVYTYLPWHLGTVYVRGAYAEAWLWAFLPFILWAIDRLTERRFLSAALAGLVASVAALWTQPGLFVLAVPLFVSYGLALDVRSPRSRRSLFLLALALTLLLLWLVARAVPEGPTSFNSHFLYPFQLFSAAWGTATSYQLGLAGVGLSIVAVALWFGGVPERSAQGISGSATPDSSSRPVRHSGAFGRALWFWVIALLFLALLTLPLSAIFWQASGFSAFLTYPWQVLALAGLPLAFLAGSVVRLDRRLATLPAWAGLLALVVLASYAYLAPRFTGMDPGSEPVAIFQPADTKAPEIMLLDYEIAPPAEITPTLTLTMTWQALGTPFQDYTVFVHTLAEGDAKAAQRDTYPCDGDCPTSTWQPGQIVVDRHKFDLSPAAPPGPYRLAVGLYLLDTGERVAVTGRDDGTVFLDVP